MKKKLCEKSTQIEIDKLPQWKPRIFLDAETIGRAEKILITEIEKNSINLDSKFAEIVDKCFWELI